jgi:GNAT superfamily N-acetyltransferase
VQIEYRTARDSDIPHVAAVFATAIDDLDKKYGFLQEPTPRSPPHPQYSFWLRKDPKAFWVAEDKGRVVGYSFSFLRGTLWFLADLFILPGYQGKGIGGTLIKKTLGSWSGQRITNRALITPAYNMSSVSLYMRYEMLPRQAVYFASAPKDAVARSLDRRKPELEAEEAGDFRKSSSMLDRIHREAMGFPSGWQNEFFFEALKAKCLVFRKNGRLEGYAFVRPMGGIGPLVVKSASSFAPALEIALRAASEGDGKVGMFFPGTNRAAVMASISHGFKIEYPGLLLSSRPMGDFENYLFYSPSMM